MNILRIGSLLGIGALTVIGSALITVAGAEPPPSPTPTKPYVPVYGYNAGQPGVKMDSVKVAPTPASSVVAAAQARTAANNAPANVSGFSASVAPTVSRPVSRVAASAPVSAPAPSSGSVRTTSSAPATANVAGSRSVVESSSAPAPIRAGGVRISPPSTGDAGIR